MEFSFLKRVNIKTYFVSQRSVEPSKHQCSTRCSTRNTARQSIAKLRNTYYARSVLMTKRLHDRHKSQVACRFERMRSMGIITIARVAFLFLTYHGCEW